MYNNMYIKELLEKGYHPADEYTQSALRFLRKPPAGVIVLALGRIRLLWEKRKISDA
jgi:hypothetical protein